MILIRNKFDNYLLLLHGNLIKKSTFLLTMLCPDVISPTLKNPYNCQQKHCLKMSD